jgi:hypothetical protein
MSCQTPIRVLIILALALPLALPTTAAAQDYPRREGDLASSASDRAAAPGEAIELSGSGYEPGSRITITIESDPLVLDTVTADASGAFRVMVNLPADFPLGAHTLKSTGPAPGGGVLVLSQPLAITADGTPLTSTGADRTTTALVAALIAGALALAAPLVVRARRRA